MSLVCRVFVDLLTKTSLHLVHCGWQGMRLLRLVDMLWMRGVNKKAQISNILIYRLEIWTVYDCQGI
jgi:hypothetical protein